MNLSRELPSLLLVDDDELFCRVLSSALEKRGFSVQVSHNVEDATAMIGDTAPECAVVDLNMPGDSGLLLVERLHQLDEHTRILVLTGYASIATAVEAIKLGATHYLAKPADADEVVAALGCEAGNAATEIAEQPMSTRRLEWEHIQKMLVECDGNISATARKLGMHRRTLQRKLAKHPVKT
ncbi:MAG: response regulator transcription factor [Mariprofundaceae bacterium]|nr:response regulator transcription factor [Mariprofundaceae bacterium]